MAKIDTPVFDDSVTFDQYKKEVDAWGKVTSLNEEKRAVVLVLAMPDKKADILENVNIDTLNAPGGIKVLMDHLEKHYTKDKLVESLDYYEEFRNYERGSGQNINEYCKIFDKLQKRISTKGITIPNEILAFELIRNAKISKEERKLVLTGLNLEKKDDLYKDAISSLKKFLGESYGITKYENECNIKVEGAYATWNKNWRGGPRGRSSGYRNLRSQRMRGSRGFRGGNYHHNESLNPLGKDGKRLKCFVCNSIKHMVFQCPMRYTNEANLTEKVEKETQDDDENSLHEAFLCENHIIMYTGYNKNEINELCYETSGCAILDSACSSNVTGESWYRDYINNFLSEEDKKLIKIKRGWRFFKFGVNSPIKSSKEVELPVKIGGKKLIITVDVIQAHVPFLMSKEQMKQLKMKIDLTKDMVEFDNKKINLNESNSGHYLLPLNAEHDIIKVYATNINSLSEDEIKLTLLKLHRQFGHPANKKLKQLITDAGLWRDNFEKILENIMLNCKICKLYKKTPNSPVVAMPMAKEFNETICLDLKQLTGEGWILHIIDMHTRYTRSVLVERKESSGIIDKLFKEWFSIFGIPYKMLTDNGGEFTSEELREVASHVNIVKFTTGAEAPWQNGLCEKVHQVTDMILLKLRNTYPNVSLDCILAWANMARNSLQMYQGYSSHQLVFGTNPNLPNILQDKLPAMDESTSSAVFAKHLNLLRANREAFIKSDSCIKIKRALKHKLRCSQKTYNRGDWVYYKRNNSEKWLGPAKVMFQDNKVIFVRHGSIFYKVSINRINPAEDNALTETNEDLNSAEENAINETNEDLNNDHIQDTGVRHVNEIENKSNVLYPCSICQKQVKDEDKAIICNLCSKYCKKEVWCHINCGKVSVDTYEYLKTLDKFTWKCPKHKTKTRNTQNKLEPLNEVFVNFVPRAKFKEQKCVDAKNEELKKLKEFKVYDEIEGDPNTCINTRWIMTVKGDKIKARLVAKGFEENSLLQKDSPTVSKCGLNMLLIIAASKKWIIRTTDIKSAFLQSKDLDRDVYIKPPKEANVSEGVVWKLNKPLYGLDDASRQFYLSVKETLNQNNCKQSGGDTSFYYARNNSELEGIIISHIDDFLHGGNNEFDNNVIRPLTDRFIVGKREEMNFTYLGYQLSQGNNGIYYDQLNYIANLEFNQLQDNKDKNRILNEKEMKEYRSIIGSINWCVRGTRPDMSFELIDLSTKLKEAKVDDFNRALKVIRKLKSTNYKVFFPHIEDLNYIELVVYSDAAFHNLNDGVGSTMAYIILVRCKKSNKCCPVAWKANKIQRVVTDSLSAETLALSKAIGDTIYVQNFFKETLNITPKITAIVDNKGLAQSAYSTKVIEDKRLMIDLASIREDLNKGIIQDILWVKGQEMLADCLTKKRVSPASLIKTLSSGLLEYDILTALNNALED